MFLSFHFDDSGTPVAIKQLFPAGEGLTVDQTKRYIERELVLLKCIDASIFSPFFSHLFFV